MSGTTEQIAQMDDVLCLLMAVVLADKRIVSEEIEAFTAQSAKLQTTLNIDPRWSEAKTLVWYEMNKDEVQAQALGPNLETWLYERVSRLVRVENKAVILEAMRLVALADGELHVSEHALMVLVARRWMLHPRGDG